MNKLERDFQRELVKEIKRRLPGCYVFKTEPQYDQGIPDLLILYKNRWAALEVKRHAKAHHQSNQDYYIDDLNRKSFARFIYPENKEEVLDELQRALQSGRQARLSRSESKHLAQKNR